MRAWIWAAVVTCVCGGADVACNAVVGAGDYSVGSAGTSAGSGSTTGDSGEAGSTGAASSGVHAGSGTVGTSGVPSTSGTPGTSGAAPGTCGGSIPTGQASYQQLVNACALAVSCDPQLFPVTVSDCISNDYLQAFGSLACLATVTTCDEYYSCLGSRVASATECPTTSSADDTGACGGASNQVATFCPSALIGSITNCSKVGGTCAVYQEDDLGDVASGCMVVPSCSDTDGENHCSGNMLYVCTGGVGYGQDCSNLDASCQTIGSDTECFFNGPACATPSVSCNGNVLNQCVAGTPSNQVIQYNCGLSGLTCDTTGGVGSCVDPACSSASCTEQCSADGSTMLACVGGTQVKIPCATLGTAGTFSQCGSDTNTGNIYCY